jgi:hypothetical protein
MAFSQANVENLSIHLCALTLVDTTSVVCAKVLFNYQWLHAKLSCMLLQSVLADFEDVLSDATCTQGALDPRDVKLLADALRLSSSVLGRHPNMLGPQVSILLI